MPLNENDSHSHTAVASRIGSLEPREMSDSDPPAAASHPGDGWRRLVLWLLIFGQAGVLLELWLLEHYEDVWQWAPLALLSGGFLAALWIARRPDPRSLRILWWILLVQLGSGAVGLFLHLKANVEFELELHPDSRGWQLVQETMTGAIPALAPFAMLQLGLLGMLFCWRHPQGSVPKGTG